MKIPEKQKDIIHLISISLIDIFYFSIVFFGYAIFSMLFFGEGANSFMYSKANGVIFLLLLIIPPSFLNIYLYTKSQKKRSRRHINFIIVQVIMFVVFIFTWYLLGWGFDF